jgi:hypothetical protein
MATQQVNREILTPTPMQVLGSPYCYDPTCKSCRELRAEHDRVNGHSSESREA